MVGRQRDNLIDLGVEERFVREKQGADSLLDKGSEGGVEFCVVGLDREWSYQPDCRRAQP